MIAWIALSSANRHYANGWKRPPFFAGDAAVLWTTQLDLPGCKYVSETEIWLQNFKTHLKHQPFASTADDRLAGARVSREPSRLEADISFSKLSA